MNDAHALTLLLAVFAPVVAGVITLFLPRKSITPRVLIAALGPAASLLLLTMHVSEHGIDGAAATTPAVHHVEAAADDLHATADSSATHTTEAAAEPASESAATTAVTTASDAASDIEHHPAPVVREYHATTDIPWVPSLNLNIAFLADGLGVFFAMLVAGIGLLIVLYARGYFGRAGDDLYRFYPTLGFFATAMLGVVLSDYMLQTLMFWELTSISSFLLIGWDRYDKHAVKLAMQAFFTTGMGGMGLFGGILLFGDTTGVWRWSDLLNNPAAIDLQNGYVIAAFCLMFFGAASKSAQWPFHYWLPGAMAAPTPVSAYLHSATMVKAGVFLVARMHPAFQDIAIWPWLILIPGSITMLMGAAIAINQHDLKRIFAYTTVSQLGLLMCAYGFSAFDFHGAAVIDWDISQIANHAFYKAPLFIIAGALGHVASRQLPELHGLWKRADFSQKAMVVVMLLAGYALAGGPGTVSFPAKELFFYAAYHAASEYPVFWIIAVMAVLTAMFNVAIFVRLFTTLLGIGPGLKPKIEPVHAAAHATHDDAHDDSHGAAHGAAHGDAHGAGHGHDDHGHETGVWASMIWVPAAIIVALQYVGGLAPGAWEAMFRPLEINLNYPAFAEAFPSIYHLHMGVPLAMSAVAITLGIILGLSPMMRGAIVDVHDRIYPAVYHTIVHGGFYAFRIVQTGNMRTYMALVLVAFLLGFAATIYHEPTVYSLPDESLFDVWPALLVGFLCCLTALLLPMVKQRVVRVLVLGTCGFSVVSMFLLYQAPDLALTQLMFEIISVILFVLVLRLLPDEKPKAPAGRWWRITIACAVGLVFGWVTLIAAAHELPFDQQIGSYFLEYSNYGPNGERGGGGSNVVNVILVDFRGFDTLGEISVLAIAAIGVWSMLPGRKSRAYELKQPDA